MQSGPFLLVRQFGGRRRVIVKAYLGTRSVRQRDLGQATFKLNPCTHRAPYLCNH